MPTCPDCNSTSVQSKGSAPNGNRRYVCNNCHRSFTLILEKNKLKQKAKADKLVSSQEEKIMKETANPEKAKINIQVSIEIQNWLTQLKLIQAESYDSVLRRIKEKKVIL